MKMVLNDKVKSERQRLYFDLICGVICSTSALAGIMYVTIMFKITNVGGWLTGLTFWIFYLILSISCIVMGIYSKWKEKQFDERKPRKDLKPPIV